MTSNSMATFPSSASWCPFTERYPSGDGLDSQYSECVVAQPRRFRGADGVAGVKPTQREIGIELLCFRVTSLGANFPALGTRFSLGADLGPPAPREDQRAESKILPLKTIEADLRAT